MSLGLKKKKKKLVFGVANCPETYPLFFSFDDLHSSSDH